jgi:flagellar protein FlaG
MDVTIKKAGTVARLHVPESKAPGPDQAQIKQNDSATNSATKAFEPQVLDTEKLMEEVGKLNQMLNAVDMNTITFRVHEDSEQLYAQLVNMKTQEVIKTFPPEYMLELAAKMKDLVGMLIDEKI